MFARSIIALKTMGISNVSRRFTSESTHRGPKLPPPQTFEQKRNNAILATALAMFVAGVYYTAIRKMRPEKDALQQVIAEENMKDASKGK